MSEKCLQIKVLCVYLAYFWKQEVRQILHVSVCTLRIFCILPKELKLTQGSSLCYPHKYLKRKLTEKEGDRVTGSRCFSSSLHRKTIE